MWHIPLAPVPGFMVMEAIKVPQDTDPPPFVAQISFFGRVSCFKRLHSLISGAPYPGAYPAVVGGEEKTGHAQNPGSLQPRVY